VAAWKIPTHRRRLIDAALWALTVGLAFITLLLSFDFSPPGSGRLPLDEFGHGLMYFATFFCFLLAAVWRPPGAATARSRRRPGPRPRSCSQGAW
jgi:hypothetical protein